MLTDDRYELITAAVDGELTPAEAAFLAFWLGESAEAALFAP